MSTPEFIEYGFTPEPWGAHPPLVRQRHSASVVEVDERGQPYARRGDLNDAPPIADGCWTAHADTEVYCFTADCIPLLFFGPDRADPIAAVHAGWRGLLAGVVGGAIESLGVPRAALRVIVGPAVRGCCYEVRADFVQAFRAAGHELEETLFRRDGRLYFDLPTFAVREALRGIPAAQICTRSLRCTACSEDRLPSFRRDGRVHRHLRAWIRKGSPTRGA